MFGRTKRPNDFEAEIESHLRLEMDRLIEEGRTEEEARHLARRAFGNVSSAQERFYESRRVRWWDVLRQDVRFGLRILAKSRGSTCVAILTLALGIGANTAIFGLLNTLLLRNLPVPHPNELVLFGKGEWVGSQDTLPDRSWQLFSYPFFREFQEKNHVYTNVAAIDSIMFGSHGRIGSSPQMEKLNVELVSGTYFQTLGVNPAAGRVLTEADDRTPGAHAVAVASYSWWHRRLAESPSTIGSTVSIGDTAYSIIGVTSPDFFGTTLGQSPDLWIPLAMEKQISPGWNGLDNKLFQSLYIIARLKPGINTLQASAETNLLFKRILYDCARAKPSGKQLSDIQHAQIELTSAATGLPGVRVRFSSPLKILMGLVGLVLLIACSNVASLLLARAISRRREIAVRMSIGASRARLIRQLLVESGLLGFGGAVLGAFLAWASTRSLLAMIFGAAVAPPVHVAPDPRVLGFVVATTLVTVFLFGMAPALQATRVELAPTLKDARAAVGAHARNQLSRSLIAVQVALSLMLIVAASLFSSSLINLNRVDIGFDKEHVLIIGIDPSAAGYEVNPRLESMMDRVEEQVSVVPGIQAASFAFMIFNGGWTEPVAVPGRPKSDDDPEVFHNIVGSPYLSAMKEPVVLGRDLLPSDSAASKKAAVINETMARTYFGPGSPIGRAFSVGPESEWRDIEVVGVVRDAKYMNVPERPRPAAFYPRSQHPMFLYNLVVHYEGSPATVVPEIRNAIHQAEPNLPVGQAIPLSRIVSNSVRNQRLVAALSDLFGVLAAFLACIGIYGVVSYGITRRTNEFGVRMALGAKRWDVLRTALDDIVRLVSIGAALGLVFSVAASRWIQSQLYGLSASDPIAIGVALIAMIVVALFAAYIPARRATKIDPMVALRYE